MMAEAIKRIVPMKLEAYEPYYTVNPRQNHMIKANFQVLQVISGVAWVSNNGEDFVLMAAENLKASPVNR